MITTLSKWGNSLGVRLPQKSLSMLGLKQNSSIEIITTENSIILKPVDTPSSLAELFEGYDGDYQPEEFDWGEPVGREIW
jgi:antitoxin MazE